MLFDKIKKIIPDSLFISLRFRYRTGYWPNLKKPKTFCEKLQWLKLNNRDSKLTKLVDKYEVKQYVADIIGMQYIIPSIGVWESVEDIDWNQLPDQFVLKPTHDSGGLVICQDKTKLDVQKAKKKLKNSLSHDYYLTGREWPYKNVKHRIIAEKFMQDDSSDSSDLTDYKFFCFDGVPTYCQVIRDRNTKETIDFYDMQWNHMPFYGLNPIARNGLKPVVRPENLELMIDICHKLADSAPFTRIDLYVINNNIYFGEITFFPASGMGVFTPSEWDEKLGSLITLPTDISR